MKGIFCNRRGLGDLAKAPLVWIPTALAPTDISSVEHHSHDPFSSSLLLSQSR